MNEKDVRLVEELKRKHDFDKIVGQRIESRLRDLKKEGSPEEILERVKQDINTRLVELMTQER